MSLTWHRMQYLKKRHVEVEVELCLRVCWNSLEKRLLSPVGRSVTLSQQLFRQKAGLLDHALDYDTIPARDVLRDASFFYEGIVLVGLYSRPLHVSVGDFGPMDR